MLNIDKALDDYIAAVAARAILASEAEAMREQIVDHLNTVKPDFSSMDFVIPDDDTWWALYKVGSTLTVSILHPQSMTSTPVKNPQTIHDVYTWFLDTYVE